MIIYSGAVIGIVIKDDGGYTVVARPYGIESEDMNAAIDEASLDFQARHLEKDFYDINVVMVKGEVTIGEKE